MVRYAAWNAAISAAAGWRETVAAGASGASYGFQVTQVTSASAAIAYSGTASRAGQR
jgi:hypothetical protein